MKKEVVLHPGIYRFKWPYLTGHLVPNDAGDVTVYDCDVEMRVGQEEDLQEGKLITIIITSYSPPGIQSSIERIATKIRLAFFGDIFHERHWEKAVVPEEQIRWIEQHLFSKGSLPGDTSLDQSLEVTMQWDDKKHSYNQPSWRIAQGIGS
ncbi:hypothetical protein ACPV3A_29515 [Paenibacillus sp. Dod16]|uniref:hypothetical protein n=1 Tax=Paenibacillus sp. Dod16 TaxID=3416392 RepID=UPI003CF8ABAD